MDKLDKFMVQQSDDPVKAAMELICRNCGEQVCDVEHLDTLDVLVSIALGHACD